MSWPDSESSLLAAQRMLASEVPNPWRPADAPFAIGAVVVVFGRWQSGPGAAGDPGWAAAATLQGRRVGARSALRCRAGWAYVPGSLALREGPCLEAAARALLELPAVLLVDATGRDHPRRAGMALHLGAVLGLPTIGVTHRPLLARGEWPADQRGAASPLLVDGEAVGAWVRTRPGARPLAVHPGWRTDVGVAVDVVMRATLRHRTPEPFRVARRLARVARAADRG